MNDLTDAFIALHDGGRLGLLAEELAALRAKATPSRGEIAMHLYAGLLADRYDRACTDEGLASTAVDCADALIAALARKGDQ